METFKSINNETMTQTGWAIKGEFGIYTGWWFTRSEAIEAHCEALGRTWLYCKRKGDKTIRIKVIEQRTK